MLPINAGRVGFAREAELVPNAQRSAKAPHDSVASVAECGPDYLVEAQAEMSVQKDAYQRLADDFDSFKKRTQRESERQAAAQKDAFINELLPTLDNLERALASGHSDRSDSLYQGVAMTLQELRRLLQRHGIEAVDDAGEQFDPHRHDAISIRHDPHQPDQTVLAVTQRGYTRGDRLFRPAKVIVNDLSLTPGALHAG